MADQQQQPTVREIVRQHLDEIEAAIVKVNARLSSTKAKFERTVQDRSDLNDPGRIGFELEQAAFQLERDRLRALREVAKTQYLRTFKSGDGKSGDGKSGDESS